MMESGFGLTPIKVADLAAMNLEQVRFRLAIAAGRLEREFWKRILDEREVRK